MYILYVSAHTQTHKDVFCAEDLESMWSNGDLLAGRTILWTCNVLLMETCPSHGVTHLDNVVWPVGLHHDQKINGRNLFGYTPWKVWAGYRSQWLISLYEKLLLCCTVSQELEAIFNVSAMTCMCKRSRGQVQFFCVNVELQLVNLLTMTSPFITCEMNQMKSHFSSFSRAETDVENLNWTRISRFCLIKSSKSKIG